jgi:hypothetical protein
MFGDFSKFHSSLIEYYNFLSREYQIPIALHFYAPYHGHSICDRHFGIGKKELKKQNLGIPIFSLNAIVRAFATITNTTVTKSISHKI